MSTLGNFLHGKVKRRRWIINGLQCRCARNFNNHVAKPSLFKTFTNFTLGEFEELAQLVSTIISHARFIREHHDVIG